MKNILALLLTITYPLQMGAINVTPLTNPIFPYKVGSTYITLRKHTFIKYIETSQYEQYLSQIQKVLDGISLCAKEQSGTSTLYELNESSPDLEPLKNHVRDSIQQAYLKLSNLKPQPIRRKRALFNFVGRAQGWLFGTLTDEDGERYDKVIATLDKNQQSIYHDFTDFVSISKNFMNETTKLFEKLNYNNKIIKQDLNELSQIVKNRARYMGLQQVLNMLLIDCNLLIEHIDNIQNSITFAELRTLTNSILPLNELMELISLMKQKYNDQILDFHIKQEYYRYLYTELKYHNDNILILIHFPIVEKDVFDLFHLFPIPINNTTIIPYKPYILMNSSTHHYQEHSCHLIDKYCITHVNGWINQRDCIPQILRGNTQISGCPLTAIDFQMTLVEPVNDAYIIILPTQTVRITQECQPNGFTDISTPSLIQIPEHCTIVLKDIRYSNDETPIQGAPFHLPTIPKWHPSEATRKIQIPGEIQLDELTKIQSKSSEFVIKPLDKVINIDGLKMFDIILIGVIVLILLFALYKFSKYFIRRKPNHPLLLWFSKSKPTTTTHENQDLNDVFP